MVVNDLCFVYVNAADGAIYDKRLVKFINYWYNLYFNKLVTYDVSIKSQKK